MGNQEEDVEVVVPARKRGHNKTQITQGGFHGKIRSEGVIKVQGNHRDKGSPWDYKAELLPPPTVKGQRVNALS